MDRKAIQHYNQVDIDELKKRLDLYATDRAFQKKVSEDPTALIADFGDDHPALGSIEALLVVHLTKYFGIFHAPGSGGSASFGPPFYLPGGP